jgi:transcriptional regulator with XRE-family HTH domain
MESGLGNYIRRRREELKMTAAQLVEQSGVSKSHLSQIEKGKIAFPNAEIRRRLAWALGVSHVDLLVAAGELNAEEVVTAGVEGAVQRSAGSEAVHQLADRVDWSVGERRSTVEGILRMYLAVDARAGRTAEIEEDVPSDHEQYILPMGKGEIVGSL